ncbi:hypothetical protein B7L70_01760 [Vulcanisaeta sp. EB80]|uniref:hypothetical protein n=1 Tax=Vulcanisaeta sp. EB80 TaxID=1650660 RepID=UPI0009C049A2|nr:hypothetical protein [Vulcanisaeta sp. EB80]PLC68708.1 hypothetical protein B7L70_01760 [Vulcanisaeta sp. EB80]
MVVLVVVENSPCIAGVDGFLSSIINEVVDYLVNGDVPSRVLKSAINRRVSNAVSRIMGVVHVKGHRWPSTIESILSRTAHALLKETALGVRSSRFIPSLTEFCAYIDEVRAVICGSPDLLIHDLRGKSACLVELRLAPTFGDYTPFIKMAAIKLAIYSWLFSNYYVGNSEWQLSYIALIHYAKQRGNALDAVLHPICIRVTDTIRSFITNAYRAWRNKSTVRVSDCRLARLIYGRRFTRCVNEEVLIDIPRDIASINEAINNKLFRKWKTLQSETSEKPR